MGIQINDKHFQSLINRILITFLTAIAMFQFIKDFFNPSKSKESAIITMHGLLVFFAITSILISMFLTFNYLCAKPWFVFTNTAIIILAISISGFLLGFIFGIPRSVRFRFDKTKDKFANLEGSDNVLADNTNLEEISDWVTKIIIGLTLIEGRKIIQMIENGSRSIANSYPKCDATVGEVNLFVFSYCLILFFAGYGFFGGYFWARTLFGSILIQSRKQQESIQREIAILSNRNLSNAVEEEIGVGIIESTISLTSLKEKIANLLSSTPITDSEDTQKGRWGGLSAANDRKLTITVQQSLLSFYDVIIEVTSTSESKPLTSTVVILLDSTFPEQLIYLKPVNNVAKVTIIAFEAFTVAAICDNLETKLELDLQMQKGLPPKFYYEV